MRFVIALLSISVGFLTLPAVLAQQVAMPGIEAPLKDWHAYAASKGLYSDIVTTGIARQPEIFFLAHLPGRSSLVAKRSATEKDPDLAPKGLIIRVTHFTSPGGLFSLLDSNDPIMQVAKRHELAVLTFTTETHWHTHRSYDQINHWQRQEHDRNFDRLAASWRQGVMKMAAAFDLPTEGFLIYGYSRGAHYSHRLVLREPRIFQAAHVHVGNSYDRPNLKASDVVWLISTGDMDNGEANALQFYRNCTKMNYPAIFQRSRGLGHSQSRHTIAMAAAFFEMVLTRRAELSAQNSRSLSADVSRSIRQEMQNGDFTGDYWNERVLQRSLRHTIADDYQIPLPSNSRFLKAWGTYRE